MAADAKIAHIADCVTLSFAKGTSSLPAEHKLYLVSVLEAKRNEGADSFVFAKNTMGSAGLADLVRYLNENGYTTNVDSEADVSLDFHSRLTEQYEEAISIGQKIKKHSPTSFPLKGFARRLKPFQVGAAQHMSVVTHAANFSVPGSGKTTITLAAYLRNKQQGSVKRLVVVGPRACFAPWEGEYRACLKVPGRVVRIWSNWKARQRAWDKARSADLVLLNYNVAQNDRPKLEKLLKTAASDLAMKPSWETEPEFVSALNGNPIKIVTLPEMLNQISDQLGTTVASSQFSRTLQLIKAAGMTVTLTPPTKKKLKRILEN